MYSHVKWGIWNKPISRNAKTTTTNSAYGWILPILPNSQMKVIRQFLKTAFQEVSMKHRSMSKNFSLPRRVLLHALQRKHVPPAAYDLRHQNAITHIADLKQKVS